MIDNDFIIWDVANVILTFKPKENTIKSYQRKISIYQISDKNKTSM